MNSQRQRNMNIDKTSNDHLATIINLFIEKAQSVFKERVISIFKIGSLGKHGDFSYCSDVDVALFLDTIRMTDYKKVATLWNNIKRNDLIFAERLSVFWSSYDSNFDLGLGRFPALDRLDLLQGGLLLYGEDKRSTLNAPTSEQIICESGRFILDFMLSNEKLNELLTNQMYIVNKGARYFSKFILFPVRLLWTLDNPDVVVSNKEALSYFKQQQQHLNGDLITLVDTAYQIRNEKAYQEISIESMLIKQLIPLYRHCVLRYSQVLDKLDIGTAQTLKNLLDVLSDRN